MTAGMSAGVIDSGTSSEYLGRLNHHAFPTPLPCQLDVQDADALPADDREHRVVPVPVDLRVNRNNACLANQRGEFIFDPGADACVTIQFELAVFVELKRISQVDKILL